MKYFRKMKVPKDEFTNRTTKIDEVIYDGFLGAGEHSVDNFIFDDTIVLTGLSRGRSSVKANFRSDMLKTPTHYEMFIIDLFDIIKNKGIKKGGKIKGKFSFRKRGRNYGIYMIKENQGE